MILAYSSVIMCLNYGKKSINEGLDLKQPKYNSRKFEVNYSNEKLRSLNSEDIFVAIFGCE